MKTHDDFQVLGVNKKSYVHWDVEIFLDMPVIWTDFENLVSPNNKICSRNIKGVCDNWRNNGLLEPDAVPDLSPLYGENTCV